MSLPVLSVSERGFPGTCSALPLHESTGKLTPVCITGSSSTLALGHNLPSLPIPTSTVTGSLPSSREGRDEEKGIQHYTATALSGNLKLINLVRV